MPRDWDDDPDDWPEDDDSGSDTVVCPNCGADVYEDAEQCPRCGEWITDSTHPLAGRSRWFVWAGLLGIAAVILTLILARF